MEREQDRFRRLRDALRAVGAIDHNLRHHYSDSMIVQVLFWAVMHDRPIYWACDRGNWPATLCPALLPSQSCMSRRLRSLGVQQLLQRLAAYLRDQLPSGFLKFIDAKPLPVGGCTKDSEARYGRCASGMAKGYKLFAVVDGVSGAVDSWLAGPMNWSEQKAALKLIESLAEPCVLVGDGVYDARFLYDAAAARGCELIAHPAPTANGRGHGRISQIRSDALATARTSVGAALINARTGIERTLGQWTSFGGGLGPLPAWVRTPHRVTTWLAAKHVINLARQIVLQQTKGCAA